MNVKPQFSVAVVPGEEVSSLAFAGEFDLYREAEATLGLETALGSTPRTLVVDLRELTFMDSSAVRWLMLTRRRCGAEGRRLQLVPAAPTVHRVLQLCELERLFEFVEAPEATAA